MVEPGRPGAVEAPWMPQPAPPPADNLRHPVDGEQAGGDNPAAPHVAPAGGNHAEVALRHNGLGVLPQRGYHP